MSEPLSMPINCLNLSTRARNALRRLGVQTVAELSSIDASSLADIGNCGKQTISEIRMRLDQIKHGTHFSSSIEKVSKNLRVPFDSNKKNFLRDAAKIWDDEVNRRALERKIQREKTSEFYSKKEHLDYRRLQMVRLFLDGKNLREIAEENRISSSRVSQILRAETRKYKPDIGAAVSRLPIEELRGILRGTVKLAPFTRTV
jgi:DNA-binding CsgD family transcriptional regulator